MIKLVVFDIDGVLTDGCIYVDASGREQKRVNLKDIDAVFEIRKRGYKIAALTGESTEMAEYFRRRIPWDHFELGCKKKLRSLQKLAEERQLAPQEICYVGDGKYDREPMAFAGLGICPSDAIRDVTELADVVLTKPAGSGGVWELIRILEAWDSK
jgi:YrbI family 3-deoxy-D-manno-octulosonate 8-phosphate phosphatase